MGNDYLNLKSICNKAIKYFIFIFAFLCAFVAVGAGGGKALAIESATYTIHQSNHKGNNTNSDQYYAIKSTGAYGSGWYVQGRGVSMKDVVTVTLEIPYREINGLVVFESGYTGSSTNKSYDSYKKNTSGVWENLVDATNGLAAGSVVPWNDAACTGFVSSAANNTSLKANSASATLYSTMCINEVENDKITIKYAYTIRNAGYGLKTIRFVVYNDVAYDPSDTLPNDPMKAEAFDVQFVLSKPINEFGTTGTDSTNGFTWINSASVTCGTHTTSSGYPTTNDICVTYINAETKKNEAKPMNFELPKEIAYVHDSSVERDAAKDNKIKISSIKDNTIYGTNSFKNVGSENANGVKYYYHAFNVADPENGKMDPTKTYKLVIQIDASGEYVFYIKDLFGNKFDSEANKVVVNDVSITDVIVDYTNEHNLTIMKATGVYDGGKYQNNWLFSIDASNTIEFTKIQADDITLEIYVFQKVVIGNGVFAGNGTDGSETGYEDIAKQPLGNDDAYASTGNPNRIVSAVFWRIADPSSTDDEVTNKVECQTDEDCEITIAASNYSEGSYSDGRQNKITLTLKHNGMYRISITDNFGNSTNSPRTGSDTEKNPSVEITVIDRTTPIVSSDLSSDAAQSSTKIESFPYVTGGGQKNPSIPDVSANLTGRYWENTESYKTIYYNVAGSKFFNYKDALEIAKIKVVDDVKFYSSTDKSIDTKHSYEINFGYNANQCLNISAGTTSATVAGTYCDPTAGLLSDRNSSGTAYNLHNYIIANNITSFSGGLVKQVGYTAYSETDYTKLTSATTDAFVNAKTATTFLGYLKIKFVRTSNNEEICTVVIDANDANGTTNTTNKSCFETMNKYIDEVEDFKMVFAATDYNETEAKRHTSREYTVSVVVIDTTAPGIDKTGIDDDAILYSNETTECRLEIDNVLQSKGNGIPNLLDCYKLRSGSTYYFKDNNINNTASNNTLSDAKGKQYYDVADTSDDYYHKKITLRILEDGEWIEATDEKWDEAVHSIQKSGYHQFEITIYDHWATKNGLPASDTETYKNNNVLTIYVTYYVNPRTILIEPIAIDKMYGENEPVIDYCVYINTYEDTFYYEDDFFEKDFINSYFDRIYCTKDIYVPVDSENKYTRSAEATVNGYDIYKYTPSPSSGTYLKVNNTYVKINNDATTGNLYNMSYTPSATGEYLDIGGNKYEILSGYIYNDASCLFAYTGTAAETAQYLKANGNCTLIQAGNRYTKSYTRSSAGTYLKYNDGNPNLPNDGRVNDALVNNNEFAGKLARVESRCYNSFAADVLGHSNAEDANFATYLSCNENSGISTVVRNDNVGQYNIVLGTISIKEGEGTTYNEDYVIKMNTNYLSGTFQLGGTQTITKTVDEILVDDGLKTESNVKFTIRQAVLTVEVKDDDEFKRSKKFGEQDPYSNNWNVTAQGTNIVPTGYLGGYSVWGWRYNGLGTDNDSSSIISGTLRRKAGEEVGIYDICNISGNPSVIVASECSADHVNPGLYDGTDFYKFAAYGKYDVNGASTTAALTINTNGTVYGTPTGRTLNTNTRNYAISFIKGDFFIESIDLIIQPGINQGKEYAGTPYNDPLWQLVVYGETIKNNSGTWSSNITKDDAGFTGYTAEITVERNNTPAARGTAPYIYGADGDPESEIYYMRRKVSPQTTYEYVDYIELATADRYTKADGFYYKSASGRYIYAHGRYYEILAANTYNGDSNPTQSDTGTHLKVVVEGRLVNQTYTLFTNDFVLERETGESVDWYSYVEFKNFKKNGDGSLAYYTLKGVNTGVNQCTIAEGGITVSASGTETCRNYNVVYEKDAPVSVKNAGGAITGYQTTVGTSPVYTPDGNNACTSTAHYSKACEDSQKNEILFEIFKREIILEFIDDNYTFVYGQRYNYYDGGVATSGSAYSYNTNANGIFHIDDNSEGDIFLCYSDIGNYLVDCTTNADYGVTSGDTWAGIGLKFYLHSAVSAYGSGYYGSGTNDKALPAGTYYVYAEIAATDNAATNTAVLNNYKFTYRGGTLTIKPKVTGVQLTSYTKEYGETLYSSYGIGSDYSDYVYYTSKCMSDASYLVIEGAAGYNNLITDCSITSNTVGNKYGFVIDGLDSKDAIANNFNGRPLRGVQSGIANHQYDGVGYYAINVGTIKTIIDTSVSFTGANTVAECITNLDANGIVNNTKCVLVHAPDAGDGEGVNEFNTLSGANAINYDITYSLANNEGGYLFILPASLEITVYENQTKMYGCAYYEYNISEGSYHTGYTYKDGYTNCKDATSKALDLAYKYNIKGDKDSRDASNGEYKNGYDVTIDADGNKKFLTQAGTALTFTTSDILTDGRLYRVTYTDNIAYNTARDSASADNYQGQAVGVYTITLGDLNVNVNGNSMCDAYNNPVLEGGSPCRNYNINYYGNSTTTDVDTHVYVDKKDVNVSDLALYTLNYTADDSGNYVLINGKFVHVNSLKTSGSNVIVSNYVLASSLQKYKKLAQYEEDTNGTYVYLDGYKLITNLSASRYTDSTGATQSDSGNYLKVTKNGLDKYVKLSDLTKYKQNYADGAGADSMYATDSSGAYVKINNEYVQLISLKKYACTDGVCSEAANGAYVLIYETTAVSELTRYKLTATSTTMYAQDGANTAKNVYAFINGSFVPYNSLTISGGKVNLNMANIKDGTDVVTTRGTASEKVKFIITARVVFVHPEYNVKAYGDPDVTEYISCKEIVSAYGISSQLEGRSSYCTSNAADQKVNLGSTMYYAVQNSLAKSPWTVWTDKGKSGYNDIQFDVLTGQVSRKSVTNDPVGKYTFDFGNVTTNDALSGNNYMIVYVTSTGTQTGLTYKTSLDNTYIAKSDGSGKDTLYNLLTETCTAGSAHCVQGKKITEYKYNDTSVSLLDKFISSTATTPIDYWYLGFYDYDPDRSEYPDDPTKVELKKWWQTPTDASQDRVFMSSYNSIVGDTTNNIEPEARYMTTKDSIVPRTVYFEIVRRTIFLYAVDTSKIYGNSDNYANFLVAICGNSDGYKIEDGKIKCHNTDEDPGYGLSDDDKNTFLDNGAMKQAQIKNNGTATMDYIFSGTTNVKTSFGIYFRRDAGEDAGSYQVTACAAQSDVTDCTDRTLSEKVNTPVNYLGDNYNIIEIPGTLTIKTRVIDITPDSGQGFQYGNNTEDGSMPNITFTESHNGGNGLVYGYESGNSGVYLFDGTNAEAEIKRVKDGDNYTSLYEFNLGDKDYYIDGIYVIEKDSKNFVAKINVSASDSKNTKTVVIDGTTYTIIQKARCLINVSGLSTICISDAQNEQLAMSTLNSAYYVYGANYNTAEVLFSYRGQTNDTVAELTSMSYSTYDVYGDIYSNPANAENRNESMTRSALGLACGSADDLRYSRDVCSYVITGGELEGAKSRVSKTRSFYVYITESKRYSDANGTNPSASGNYLKYGDGLIAEIITDNLYDYNDANDLVKNTSGKYLKVTTNNYNYTIGTISTGTFNVTAAELTVTPVEKQYKIYGEADIEIKFTVETTYVVSRTKYQTYANSNIIKVCNGATDCYDSSSNPAISSLVSGGKIRLVKGWTVTLNSYAYNEENSEGTGKGNNLDYGINYTATKHGKTAQVNTQSATSAIHFDKYTDYKTSINTSRILIGNLYVDGHVQTVGEKAIVSGLFVGKNNLASQNSDAVNYNLTFTTGKIFVIVPRPVNVEIENIVKTYGQATDSESCDGGYDTSCIVGDGILQGQENESLLINNFNILQKDIQESIPGSSWADNKLIVTLETDYYKGSIGGIQVVYMTSDGTNIDYSKTNMPIAVSRAIAEGAIYYAYASVPEGDVGKYYTASGSEEKKNTTLNIAVERQNYNVARDSSTCLYDSDSHGCEDVGEYYLKFKVRGSEQSAETTVVNGYYNRYWKYNPNYYIIIYNNFEASGWSTEEVTAGYKQISEDSSLYYTNIIDDQGNEYTGATYVDNSAPKASATLKIRKRPIQIVIETIDTYNYQQANEGTHLLVQKTETIDGESETVDYYFRITTTNRYNKAGEDTYIQSATGTYLCEYSASIKDEDCHSITASARYNLVSTKVGEKYAIEQNMDVPELLGPDNERSTHHTTYDRITWYEIPKQVRTGDKLVGRVAYCTTKFDLGGTTTLDTLRNSGACTGNLRYYEEGINIEGNAKFFNTEDNGYYVITRDPTELYINYSSSERETNETAYEVNNYTTTFVNGILQIDLDETPPVINVDKEFVLKEANGNKDGSVVLTAKGDEKGDLLDILETLAAKGNGCANLVATRDEDNAPSTCAVGTTFRYETEIMADKESAEKYILQWFFDVGGDTRSYDPSIMRANIPLGKRYDARWYIAVQKDFNQQKVGDYSIFLYAQDNAGNISFATMVTLRIVDNTAPEVGTLNLYNAKVRCKAGTDCSNVDNWEVAEDIYLPISTLTASNIAKITDKTKYAFVSKTKNNDGSYTYTYTVNNYFGTYYKITAGTDVEAVLHSGWTNTSAGVQLTVIGGKDNSLAYLNTSDYTKYNVVSGAISAGTAADPGEYIVLGSFVNVRNLTMYREVKLNGTVESASGTTTVYIPDKAGTIVRYKGHYYDLANGSYIGTAPTDPEYTIKLYSYADKTYTPVADNKMSDDEAEYYLLDGSLYQLPSVRYTKDGTSMKHDDANGTYINFAQWENYYTRDKGGSWITFSRDKMTSDLALGQDGQRLIMIKTIDEGYTYGTTSVTKKQVTTANCKGSDDTRTCGEWQNVNTRDITYADNNGAKTFNYNISAWTVLADGETSSPDRKYAYLDTILPDVTLTDGYFKVFEYGCSTVGNCSTNHNELFGTAMDGYLFDISRVDRYTTNALTTVDNVNGSYVNIMGNIININETGRRFDKACSGGTCTYTTNASGNYVYFGVKDSVANIAGNLTAKVGSKLNSAVVVYNEHTGARDSVTPKTITSDVASEDASNLQGNTNLLESGLSSGSGFKGAANENKTFGATITGGTASAAYIADEFTTIFVYAYVAGGSTITSNNFFNQGTGYYKFMISKAAENQYKILRCNSTSVINEAGWCTPTEMSKTYTSMKAAMDDLQKVYSGDGTSANAYDFEDNDITFTVDYRVFDMAGNASYYRRRGALFTSFTRALAIAAGNGAAASSLALEIEENGDITALVNDVRLMVASNKTLRADEKILQSVYYNGELVSYGEAKDASVLSTLDTTVPGAYKVVYQVQRRDGNDYAYGTPVEITVTVKPNVANIGEGKINVSMLMIAVVGLIAVGFVVYFNSYRKREAL